MSTQEKTKIYVVDDDDDLREALTFRLELADYEVAGYASAEAFLDEVDADTQGCLITDLRMHGMSGIELQNMLINLNIKIPIIFITGYAEINDSVTAIKLGAVDFLEKPVLPERLLESVRQAVEIVREQTEMQKKELERTARFSKLSPREKEVVSLVIQGLTNKQIAKELGISFRTVEKYRAVCLAKLKAENAVDLARLYTTEMTKR